MTDQAPAHAVSRPDTLAVLRPYWRVTAAAFMGWFLDAFVQTSLMLAMPDIEQDLGVSIKMMASVLFVQSIGRAIGNTGWGWLADRYGRRLAFILGVLWFTLFSGGTAMSTGFYMLLIVQFMFGIGFGGEWTASATLLMESVPARARPMASALMMAGYEFGYFAAAGAQALILPHHSWRWLFVIGLVPALLAFLIRIGVSESPVWLKAREAQRAEPGAVRHASLNVLLAGLGFAALQAIVIMTLLEFQKAAIFNLYPTILRGAHHFTPQQVFLPVALYCAGSIVGKLACGRLAERFGEVRVMLTSLAVVVMVAWPFMNATGASALLTAAFVIGAAASGVFALVPHYLAKRFPSDTRSFGMGLSYAIGSIGQGIAPTAIAYFGTGGRLPQSATAFIVISSILSALVALAEPRYLPGETMEGEEVEAA